MDNVVKFAEYNHAFMPIAVEVVSLEDYLTWVYSKLY